LKQTKIFPIAICRSDDRTALLTINKWQTNKWTNVHFDL